MQIELLLLVGATILLSLLQLCNSSGTCSENFKCDDDAYSYPFWGNNRPSYCGVIGFELNCRDFYTEIDINYQTYRVLNISEANQIMTIARSDVWDLNSGGSECPSAFLNDTTSYKTHFEYVSDTLNYTLFYGCPFNASYNSGGYYCNDANNISSLYVTADSVGSNKNTSQCQGSILIPVRPSSVREWGSSFEYLHRGCNIRIVHFDIKPHNILLNENFCPKISDFGLAKLCSTQESYVSMSDARGTAGYIAPEVFYRNIGVVSHKSDVYSFGMMVLEIVGGRKNINRLADRTSEIFFPHWIHTRIELNEDLGLHGITSETDAEITKKMIIVGSLESLQIPPKAIPSSSLGSQHDSSST
ncbi:hypothetical protein GIB67_041751 [Kingdonia uniflora]|uniref:Protein kinase domain-containing protein n=1 Tax=Kingdonia uniflora TaxID=39325 RepID=A0A7J7P2U7_9MAGN|nr:hypothetical protein GIB67_041751 [Kingdonia uniflora]